MNIVKCTILGEMPRVEDAITRFIAAAPRKIRKRAIERMHEPKSGRFYVRKNIPGRGDYLHQASDKGEGPATDSGAYERTLDVVMRNSLEAVIQASVVYPLILEDDRPMWLPVFEEMVPALEMDLAKEILK